MRDLLQAQVRGQPQRQLGNEYQHHQSREQHREVFEHWPRDVSHARIGDGAGGEQS